MVESNPSNSSPTKKIQVGSRFLCKCLPPGFQDFFGRQLNKTSQGQKKGNLLATNTFFGRNTHDGKGC